MDKRIGYFDSNGKRILPELTIGGNPVTRPVISTMGLGDADKHFVVLDAQRVRGFNSILAELKAEVEALNPPAAIEAVPEILPAFDVPAEYAFPADAEAPVTGVSKRGRNAG